MKWIVGLGNPGPRYAGTRHNIGFDVVDRLAAQEGFDPPRRKFKALVTDKLLEPGLKLVLIKPQTYMNLSGAAVRDVLGYHGVSLEEDLTDSLLVVYDDIDLPEGRLRCRARGSAGGHRGLRSVLAAVGHDRLSRLKIGVGRREGAEAADYVLEKPVGASRERLMAAVDEAVAALRLWIEAGIETCMNRFNRKPEEGSGDGREPAGGGDDDGEAAK